MFVMFMVGVSLYSSTVLIPQFLQEIMGYSAEQAGMAVSSGGLVLMFLFPVAGFLAPKFDPRELVAMGFIITTFGLWRMTGHQSQRQLRHGRQLARRHRSGTAVPLHPHQHALLRRHSPGEVQRGQRHVTALMRNLGGSVGISFVTTLLARLSQKHLAMLDAHTVAGNRPFDDCGPRLAGAWMQRGSAHARRHRTHAGAQIYGMAQIQARLLAYVDVIWVMVAATAILIPLPFLMRRPKKLASAPVGH